MYSGGSTGTATLTNTSVTGNSAGIRRRRDKLARQGHALNNCTVSGNSADWGGGLYNFYGTAKLTNCTISGNSAGLGGGVYNERARSR